jgi:hypothetical protein
VMALLSPMMKMSSHAGNDAVESCCRGDLATTRCRCRVMLVTVPLSHAADDVAEATWSRHDVDAKSC